jgi:hypothetical protein
MVSAGLDGLAPFPRVVEGTRLVLRAFDGNVVRRSAATETTLILAGLARDGRRGGGGRCGSRLSDRRRGCGCGHRRRCGGSLHGCRLGGRRGRSEGRSRRSYNLALSGITTEGDEKVDLTI